MSASTVEVLRDAARFELRGALYAAMDTSAFMAGVAYAHRASARELFDRAGWIEFDEDLAVMPAHERRLMRYGLGAR